SVRVPTLIAEHGESASRSQGGACAPDCKVARACDGRFISVFEAITRFVAVWDELCLPTPRLRSDYPPVSYAWQPRGGYAGPCCADSRAGRCALTHAIPAGNELPDRQRLDSYASGLGENLCAWPGRRPGRFRDGGERGTVERQAHDPRVLSGAGAQIARVRPLRSVPRSVGGAVDGNPVQRRSAPHETVPIRAPDCEQSDRLSRRLHDGASGQRRRPTAVDVG